MIMVILNKKRMSKFNVGDMVIMTREPTSDDWYGVGEIDIPSVYYEKPHKVTKIGDHGSIELNGSFFVYPSSCFELASTATNRTKAKPCDYIVILKGRGNSDLEHKTFYVVSVTDGGHFELAEPGKGTEVTTRWTCSDPSFYKIKHQSEVVEEHKEKEYSDIGMSNYEPPITYNVGDTVVGLPSANRYSWTNEGWEGTITHIHKSGKHFDAIDVNNDQHFYSLAFEYFTLKASKSEGLIYKVDLPTFDHGSLTQRLSELQTEYFKQIKNPENGTENTESVKLQRVNLKIREGNPIRRIGLKSSGSKIKLGSNYSYN